MTILPERIIRPLRRTALALLLALLASCGPGTGGTGIGPISFSGAVASGTAAAGAITAPGLPCAACTRIDLRLDDGQVELLVPCGRFLFVGSWSAEATELALPGTFTVTRADGPASVPATLRLQFGAEGARGQQVGVVLVDAAGAPLVAATLLRGDGAPAPAACTP